MSPAQRRRQTAAALIGITAASRPARPSSSVPHVDSFLRCPRRRRRCCGAPVCPRRLGALEDPVDGCVEQVHAHRLVDGPVDRDHQQMPEPLPGYHDGGDRDDRVHDQHDTANHRDADASLPAPTLSPAMTIRTGRNSRFNNNCATAVGHRDHARASRTWAGRACPGSSISPGSCRTSTASAA